MKTGAEVEQTSSPEDISIIYKNKAKSDREGEQLYDIPYRWNLKWNDTNELTYKTERDTQT